MAGTQEEPNEQVSYPSNAASALNRHTAGMVLHCYFPCLLHFSTVTNTSVFTTHVLRNFHGASASLSRLGVSNRKRAVVNLCRHCSKQCTVL